MSSRFLTPLAGLALAALVGCGMPGAPQPPSLELPRRVEDLKAMRKGDQVILTWTTPRETTDRTRIKHLGVTRICRAVDHVAVAECVERVGTLAPEHTPLATAASFIDTLPKQLQATHASGFATYAVEVENTRGRSVSLSNQVEVPLAPTLPPPTWLFVAVIPDGVEISASGTPGPRPAGLRFAYHLYRRNQGAKREMDLGELSEHEMGRAYRMEFLDRNVEWEKTYLYKIAAVTVETVQGKEEQVLGDDSPEVQVFVHDVFPPAPPTGLQAVFSGTPPQPFIDLSWAPNTESDLAGYNVYRHEEGIEPVKINRELVKAPTYRDLAVEPGHHYFYSVTAVDVRGNESGRSAEASEIVQP
jgi:hypothetical protein